MKKTKILATTLLSAVIMLMVSCKHDDDNAVISAGGKTPVSFSSNIIAMNSVGKAVGNVWEVDDKIGIYMFEEGNINVVESVENIAYITSAAGAKGDFKPTTKTIYFPDNGSKVRFMAYYPHSASVTNSIYKVDVSNQTSQKDIDLLYNFKIDASYDKTVANKKVPLVFDHKLTKVIINVKAGEGLEESDLGDIGIHIEGLSTTANFDLTTGTLSNIENVSNITPVTATAKDNYAYGCEAIVIPTTDVPSGAKIVFNLSDGEGGASDVFSWNFNSLLKSGSKYTYNVTINRSGIVVDASINNWNEEGEEDIVAE